jgi:hypothetical protein
MPMPVVGAPTVATAFPSLPTSTKPDTEYGTLAVFTPDTVDTSFCKVMAMSLYVVADDELVPEAEDVPSDLAVSPRTYTSASMLEAII